MRSLNQIKKGIKAQNKWGLYTEKFQNKQMRLAYSYIALLFNPNHKIEDLVQSEIELISAPKDSKMYSDVFKKLKLSSYNDVDWEALGQYMWYQFQTSTYWKDSKKGIDNIFTKENYIEQNAQKRECWQKWLNSLDELNPDFNNIIIAVLRKVS